MPKKKTNHNNIFINTLISVLTGIVMLFILLSIFSVIIINSPYQKDNLLFPVLLCVSVSALISGFVNAYKYKRKGLLTGLINGAVLMMIYILLFTVFSSFRMNNEVLLLIPCCLIPSVLGGIASVNIRRK